MRYPCFWNVSPRYTAGSPAQVDESTAQHVAQQELDAYARAQEGLYGEELAERSAQLGLARIVEQWQESGPGWKVLDLLTGDRLAVFTRAGLAARRLSGPRWQQFVELRFGQRLRLVRRGAPTIDGVFVRLERAQALAALCAKDLYARIDDRLVLRDGSSVRVRDLLSVEIDESNTPYYTARRLA